MGAAQLCCLSALFAVLATFSIEEVSRTIALSNQSDEQLGRLDFAVTLAALDMASLHRFRGRRNLSWLCKGRERRTERDCRRKVLRARSCCCRSACSPRIFIYFANFCILCQSKANTKRFMSRLCVVGGELFVPFHRRNDPVRS